MTVYVDALVAHMPTRSFAFGASCHMAADTPEELRAFAERLGLKPEWVQRPGTWQEHFDLTAKLKAQALELGAVHVHSRELVRGMRERWERASDA